MYLWCMFEVASPVPLLLHTFQKRLQEFSSKSLPLLSIASGVVSSASLVRRYLIISSLLELMDKLVALPARRLSISGRMYGLPVRNIRVSGESWRIWLSELRSLTRCSGTYSSRASMYMNMGSLEEVIGSIFTLSESRDPRPPMAFFLVSVCSRYLR